MRKKMKKIGAAAVRVFRTAACAGALAVLAVAGLPLLVAGVVIYPAILWLADKWKKTEINTDAAREE